MKRVIQLFILLFSAGLVSGHEMVNIEYLGDTITLSVRKEMYVKMAEVITDQEVSLFQQQLDDAQFNQCAEAILKYRDEKKLDDWMYYQLIRRVSYHFCPKSTHYGYYTLYKWYLMGHSGYETTLSMNEEQLLFYVKCTENVYGIPFFSRDEKRFICLNMHDFGHELLPNLATHEVSARIKEGQKAFSYKIQQIPNIKSADIVEKELSFSHLGKTYRIQVKLNPQVKTLFRNYPVADFETYFNIPMSESAHASLIPALKQHLLLKKEFEGIDFLMHFTRQSFVYQNDQDYFGKERRLSPEQTLFYENSDCDDRAALFYYLVKEIYNLPMIVLLYPGHVTVAVELPRPKGRTISFKGRDYSICEPTPQSEELGVGQISKHLKHKPFEVVYEYLPDGVCFK